MKNLKGMLCALLFIAASVSSLYAGENKKPFVIPELREWRGGNGEFTPGESSRIVCTGGKELLAVAEAFARDYETMFGTKLPITAEKPRKGDFIFTIKKNKKLGKEGYTINITDRVNISAPFAVGAYWATRTILQMSEQNQERKLDRGSVVDYPDYALRGFMIDAGRKFIPLKYLEAYVKAMSYYKMNTLQIHLNDNGFKKFKNDDWDKTYSAFRLECDTYPGLTARDGSYTKQEFIGLEKMAENHFVEIIPEIDIPAHSLAFSHYRPSLGSKKYGMDHIELFNPEVYPFFDALFKEYLEGENPVFRGKRVHIGTDEYSNKDQKVVEKFRKLTDHYIKYVESFGKQACLWGALSYARGTTPVKSGNVVMAAWSNWFADPKEMKKQGYQLISIPDGEVYIVPQTGYYRDYLDTRSLYKNWTPAHIGKVVFDEKDPSILGGMFAVWNDHVGNGISNKDIYHRVFPALQTLAVKMWDGAGVQLPYEKFEAERMKLSEAPGVNELGRISKKKGLVYEKVVIAPGERLPVREIGYNYKVSFNITGEDEAKGTVLFESPDAVFYLNDPITGLMGYARDGYLNSFNYRVLPGETVKIVIEGDNAAVRLYANGKLIETKDTDIIYCKDAKDEKKYHPIRNVKTLVFPLQTAGNFKSRITDLKVYQE